MTDIHRIVFLDRDSVIANIRKPAFAHEWTEYPATTAADAMQRLRDARATIAITNKVPLRAADLAQLPDLKMIAVAATGTDIVDLAACRERGIVVSNIRNYAVHTLPEHTFALILALRRQLVAYRADIEAGLWQKSDRFCLFGHPIADLAGSRLGLFGYGALGRSVAQIARAFGMEVIVHTRSPLPDATADGVREAGFDEVLETSDIISLHLPLNDKTRNMISAKELIRMKRNALLINTARGGLVDETALADALRSGVIAGAGFDVLVKEPPPEDNVLLNLRLPNFILTPHSAWASSQAMQVLVDQLIDNVEAWAVGAPKNVLG
ncbi:MULTISPECIES: D-2-hydroxyacid dehydrogenase [unclassified Duganella]|uniref:D-2-hydroxyacid dehydrogenase n=1 Tax=unclassified Duganella TaxID=2636909 RepID=UPI000E357268|nr:MULTISPECIES: D-2-hydroxyacid dehydrogenase [unclassified Duganella]RFP16275.1 D-2-hydroxyacid dehydrogenase [Duganella sp. BJB475]RFP32563.1 D-2-hydroxyacid dehydrogenase [Duganella sp. BJB476]